MLENSCEIWVWVALVTRITRLMCCHTSKAKQFALIALIALSYSSDGLVTLATWPIAQARACNVSERDVKTILSSLEAHHSSIMLDAQAMWLAAQPLVGHSSVVRWWMSFLELVG